MAKRENCKATIGLDTKEVADVLGKPREIMNAANLLKKYRDENTIQMNKILEQMDSSGITYTYDSFGHLQCEEQESQLKYNELFDRNQEIDQSVNSLSNIVTNGESELSFDHIDLLMNKAGVDILEAQEKERTRIACDLHDSVIQNLTNLVHKTELCIMTADKDIVGVKLDLQIMMQYIREIINDIRSIVYNLRPMSFDDLGIITAVKRYAENFEKDKDIRVALELDECIDQVSTPIINLTLFRIIQEACSNAVKHGEADHISILMKKNKNQIELEINDNGKGFDSTNRQETRQDNSGFGLSIMRERVYLLSGNITITSKSNVGTRIVVVVPIQQY